MTPTRSTLLALALGTALGFALATSSGVLASRRPDVADLPWQDARLMAEVIDRIKDEYVDPVDDHELMQHAIRGMLSSLDAHSAFLDEDDLEDLQIASEGSYSGIGIEVSFEDGLIIIVAPLEGSPAERAGLATGDIIVAIDGHEVKAAGLSESVGRMRGEPGTRVRVTIDRDGSAEPLEFSIERAEIELASVRWAMLDPGYGYLRISQFSDTTRPDLERALRALQDGAGGPLGGAVLDLRGNPGGVLEAGVEVADLFLDRGLIVSATGRTKDARFSMEATPGDVLRGAPIVVLVDGGSASASEIVAGALHDNGRATLVGRTTFGKGSVQTVLPLSGGRAIKLTTSRYYTPSGTSIHEQGIEPDVVLPRRAAGPAADEPSTDPEIAAALAQLKRPAARVAGH
ncbi:MAG: carboxyl-terminal processing protease [Proteobacteria bacterium]|nr:carboxyl-terminal processing protease [Pseudomonadota bacterium]